MIWTLQFIDAEGNKRFLTGGAKRGRLHMIGRPEGPPSVVGYAEGYATAATLHEALGLPVAVTFDAGNILPVAQALKARWSNARHVIFADHDAFKGYPQAFIRKSQLTAAVEQQIARLRKLRPDVQVEVVDDEDPRLRDTQKHYNTGVTDALLAAAVVDGDVVIPRFDDPQEAVA
ncbi:hypothetical protein [Thiohalophilus sp.]|uniref:hypothetical protein n=1 Tax=Thiohalophilus sp. TaxID=3028392 RepID=UPI002ACD6FD8|nr:hypothetical protein [Thiohalophilus sp.]MDZ7804313.1 hypothetical protein [Thiohalophilus sp.]